MSAQIESKPSLIIPANQSLIFSIKESLGTPPDRFVVWVLEDGVEIAKLYLTPNTNSVAFFNLAEVVRDRVKVDDKIRDKSATLLSYSTLPFTTGRNGLKKYVVNVGTYTAGVESGTDDTGIVYLLDGVEQISAGLHPFFTDYYPIASTQKTWLTDRNPVSDVITLEASDNDEGCIAFLNDSTIIGGLGATVKTIVRDGAGLALSTFYDTINAGNGAQLPSAADINQKLTYLMVFPKNIEQWGGGVLSANPTWDSYEVTIQSGALADRSNTLKIQRLCTQDKHKNTQLAWTNSVGGWDSVLFTGRTEHTDTVSSKPFQKQIGNWDASTYTFLPQARESAPYQVTGKSSFTLISVGFSFADIRFIKYALRSDNLMMRAGSGGWMPVVIDTKSYNVKERFSGVYSVSLTVTLAQSLRC
mgnify:CR=1 FL=1|tara:strand:- start:249 stop:1496 length:1248 start_codon:yes stop_codon:yes gene_type:complete